jgi:hypothetical protein
MVLAVLLLILTLVMPMTAGAQPADTETGAVASTAPGSEAAPSVDDDVIVDIPGMGLMRLSDFPPETRRYVRIPGVDYNESPEEYGDLPPAPFPSRPDFLPPLPQAEEEAAGSVPSAGVTPEAVDEDTLRQQAEEE